MPPAGTPSQLLAVEIIIEGIGYFKTDSSNFVKNFVGINVVAGNLTLDQYSGFRTIYLCPATQTNPPCSSFRVTLTRLPTNGALFQPLMVGGAMSDKRGPLVAGVNSLILPTVTAAGSVVALQYLPKAVGLKPTAGAVWDTFECVIELTFAPLNSDTLCMFNLEEMLMPDEVLLGNFNALASLCHVFLNPQNHFPIIGLAGAEL
jgi:hypothetical protein